MADKEWSPEDDLDPVKIQKESLDLQKRFMEKIEKEEREKEERRNSEKDHLRQVVPYELPPAPTFEERSAVIVKAWTETKRIVPDAPDHVKAIVFQSLLYSASNGAGGGSFIGGLA